MSDEKLDKILESLAAHSRLLDVLSVEVATHRQETRAGFARLDAKVDELAKKVDGLDTKFNRLETRVETLEARGKRT